MDWQLCYAVDTGESRATWREISEADVAAAGGCSDTATLKQVYQQADQEGMYRVVSIAME